MTETKERWTAAQNASDTSRRASGYALPTEEMTLEERIQRIEDIIAIKNLKFTYWDAVDSKDWERYGSVFTPDYIWDAPESTGGVVQGRDQIVANGAAHFTENMRTSHLGHQHYIELIDSTHAVGTCWVQDNIFNENTSGEFLGRARYDEEYVKVDNRWYIKKTVLRYNMSKVSSHNRTGEGAGEAMALIF